jgi:hypothetical protein
MMAITKEVQLELGLEAWDPEQQAAHPRIHPPLRGLGMRGSFESTGPVLLGTTQRRR